MVIYIHGFGGSGLGTKAKQAREMFKYEIVMAPTLSTVPELAMATLRELVDKFLKKGETVNLVGSSLGGYYALYLADLFKIKAALINPSIHPYETLKEQLGMVENFYDGSKFEWTERHLNMLRQFETTRPKCENFLLLLQKGDELLDYREAVEKLPNASVLIEEGGSHQFEDFPSKQPLIEAFFKGQPLPL